MTANNLANSQFPVPSSQFPIPSSQFPVPNSQFLIPSSQFLIIDYSLPIFKHFTHSYNLFHFAGGVIEMWGKS